MSNVAIDLTKTVKEIITTMKTAIDNLNTNVDSLKSEILLAAHPVGSYYISDNVTDPGTLFGGAWKMLDPGLTLISQGKGTDKFGSFEFVAGQTYGERLHQLTVEELPTKQKYTALCDWSPNWSSDAWGIVCGLRSGRPIEDRDKQPVAPLGDGEYHNNIQPSMAAYIWKRTA